jgi:hypothetical protein
VVLGYYILVDCYSGGHFIQQYNYYGMPVSKKKRVLSKFEKRFNNKQNRDLLDKHSITKYQKPNRYSQPIKKIIRPFTEKHKKQWVYIKPDKEEQVSSIKYFEASSNWYSGEEHTLRIFTHRIGRVLFYYKEIIEHRKYQKEVCDKYTLQESTWIQYYWQPKTYLPYVRPKVHVNPEIYMEHQRQEKKKDLLLKVQSIYEYLTSNQVQDWNCDVISDIQGRNPYRDWDKLFEYHERRIDGTETPRNFNWEIEYVASELVYEEFHYCLTECTYNPVSDVFEFPDGHEYQQGWN